MAECLKSLKNKVQNNETVISDLKKELEKVKNEGVPMDWEPVREEMDDIHDRFWDAVNQSPRFRRRPTTRRHQRGILSSMRRDFLRLENMRQRLRDH